MKYLPILQEMLQQRHVSYSAVERMVGKLVSLECAVLPGLWYTRNQYGGMSSSGIKPHTEKVVKNLTFI